MHSSDSVEVCQAQGWGCWRSALSSGTGARQSHPQACGCSRALEGGQLEAVPASPGRAGTPIARSRLGTSSQSGGDCTPGPCDGPFDVQSCSARGARSAMELRRSSRLPHILPVRGAAFPN